MNHLLASLLVLAQTAQREVHCNCSDVTRIHVGPLSIPVGPLTAIYALIAATFGPVWLLALWRRRKQEREARALMEGRDSSSL